jgi:dynein heavy chain
MFIYIYINIKTNIIIILGKLKLALMVEAKSWKTTLGLVLSNIYREKLKKISEYIINKNKPLIRTIKDLEDVRVAMKCLTEVREDFISMDKELIHTEEIYTLLATFEIEISKEEQDIVDSFRYNFTNMLRMAKEVQDKICEMQEPLKDELVSGITALKKEVEEFDKDFDIKGPMIIGISAKEASER